MSQTIIASEDVVVIAMSDVGLAGFRMSSVAGTDLVASTAREDGWWGFETPLPAVFLKCAQQWPGLILDIGANTGFYSLLGLAAHPDTHSIAFEPDPAVLTILRGNQSLNGFEDRLRIENLALSDSSGVMTLYVPHKGHGLVESSSSLQKSFKDEHSAEVSVQVSTLDEFLSGDASVQLVKIDVEGHEFSAVKGAEATFARCRPIIAIELLPDAEFDYFEQLRRRLNYRSFALRPNCIVLEETMAFDQLGWNHLLVPAEKLDDCIEIFANLSLPVLQQGAA